MENTIDKPRLLHVSTRLYQALLVIYPTEFRQVYGKPMLQVFGDCCHRALREAGTVGLISLWLRTILDTVQTAIEEHSQKGVDMSRTKYYIISSWALMLSGISLLIGGMAAGRPEYNQYNFYSLPIDRYANAVALPLLALSPLLLSVGLFGLYLRFGQNAGAMGRFGLGLGILSGVIGGLGSFALGAILGGDWWWTTYVYGLGFQFLGLSLFGLVNLWQRTLPRWNGLPFLAGIWVTLIVFLSEVFNQVTGTNLGWPEAANIVLIVLTLAGLTGLGYLIQSDSQTSSETTPAT